jgi:hypothetical protein
MLNDYLQRICLTAGARGFILNLNGKEEPFPGTIGSSAPGTFSTASQVSAR